MSLAVIGWICAGVVWTVVVAVLAMMYGKAHPAIQSAIVDEATKLAKKAGG